MAVLATIAALTTGCIRPSHEGVQYSPLGLPSTVADIYLPTANGNVGTIVFVHGGGFDRGSRTDLLGQAAPLAGQTLRGWAVVSVDYRLDPYPAGLVDVAEAVRFVRSPGGAAYGLNAAKIVVVGHSAGGAIAADLALARNDPDGEFADLPPVDGWIAEAGLLDFSVPGSVTAHDAWRTGGNPDASPVVHLDAADPPGLVLHGASDKVVSVAHALRFIARAKAVGAPVASRIFNDRSPCNSHAPMCEAARTPLHAFLDRIAQS